LSSSTELPTRWLEGEARRTAGKRTAYLALTFSVLMLLSYVLIASIPGGSASDQAVQDFYVDSNRRWIILAGLYITPFAAIAFLWFIVVLRMWIAASGVREDALVSNIQLASGIVFISLVLAAAAAISTPAAAYEFADTPIDPDLAKQLPAFGDTMLFVLAMRMAAMFMIATSTIARRSGVLPRWFWILGFVFGAVLLLGVTFAPLFVVVFPTWTFILGLLLLRIARQMPTTESGSPTTT
jgi:hypothetical protein